MSVAECSCGLLHDDMCELAVKSIRAERDKILALNEKAAIALDLVSGALCDAATVKFSDELSYGDAIRELTAERDNHAKVIEMLRAECAARVKERDELTEDANNLAQDVRDAETEKLRAWKQRDELRAAADVLLDGCGHHGCDGRYSPCTECAYRLEMAIAACNQVPISLQTEEK